jgi:hypothetical protein
MKLKIDDEARVEVEAIAIKAISDWESSKESMQAQKDEIGARTRDGEKFIRERRAHAKKLHCDRINAKCLANKCASWGEENRYVDGRIYGKDQVVLCAVWCHKTEIKHKKEMPIHNKGY